jgi:hypothetical protein
MIRVIWDKNAIIIRNRHPPYFLLTLEEKIDKGKSPGEELPST